MVLPVPHQTDKVFLSARETFNVLRYFKRIARANVIGAIADGRYILHEEDGVLSQILGAGHGDINTDKQIRELIKQYPLYMLIPVNEPTIHFDTKDFIPLLKEELAASGLELVTGVVFPEDKLFFAKQERTANQKQDDFYYSFYFAGNNSDSANLYLDATTAEENQYHIIAPLYLYQKVYLDK